MILAWPPKDSLLVILCTALAVVVAACQSQRDEAFAAYLAGREANRTITLGVFGDAGDLTADPTIDFLLTNNGPQSVLLPDDIGARIFAYSPVDQSWTEVSDGTVYLPPGVPLILKPVSEEPFNRRVTGVWPIGDEIKTATHLRVLISGTLLVDDGQPGGQVVAYVEIELRH
jgi:hypothetical protein